MVILDIDMGYTNDMGDDSIDMVILRIDMGYLVTLVGSSRFNDESGSCACFS
jgi:hypothetical protein